MQSIITDFTTTMGWIILGLTSLVVVLLALEGWRLQQDRRRAFLGLTGMMLVLIATIASLLRLSTHSPHQSPLLSQLLLPLVAPVLIMSLSCLSFPSSGVSTSSPHFRRQRLFLLLLSGGAVVGASGLVVLDLFFT